MLLLNAIEQADSKCYCLLDTGANAEGLPKRDSMRGTEAQCTAPGGGVVSGMVVQVVACDGEEYHAVAIGGAAPLLPLSWLILLAGWKHLPKVDKGKMCISVQSPEGVETELTERSKMHYLDQDTFWAVLSDAWKRHTPSSGVTPTQLKESLTAQGALRDVNAVSVHRPASIRCLDMKTNRKTYVKTIVEVFRRCRGPIRTIDVESFVPWRQGLNRHKDYRKREEYLNYTINFGKYEGGHLEMLRNEEWQSCAVPLIWTEFTADIIEHRVREVASGERFSVTLFTPGHLDKLTERDWMNLESHGFPAHLYPERARAGKVVHSSRKRLLLYVRVHSM